MKFYLTLFVISIWCCSIGGISSQTYRERVEPRPASYYRPSAYSRYPSNGLTSSRYVAAPSESYGRRISAVPSRESLGYGYVGIGGPRYLGTPPPRFIGNGVSRYVPTTRSYAPARTYVPARTYIPASAPARSYVPSRSYVAPARTYERELEVRPRPVRIEEPARYMERYLGPVELPEEVPLSRAPSDYEDFPIPRPAIRGRPVYRIREPVREYVREREPNYRLSIEEPIVTRSRIDTPVYVGRASPREYRYSLDEEPIYERRPRLRYTIPPYRHSYQMLPIPSVRRVSDPIYYDDEPERLSVPVGTRIRARPTITIEDDEEPRTIGTRLSGGSRRLSGSSLSGGSLSGSSLTGGSLSGTSPDDPTGAGGLLGGGAGGTTGGAGGAGGLLGGGGTTGGAGGAGGLLGGGGAAGGAGGGAGGAAGGGAAGGGAGGGGAGGGGAGGGGSGGGFSFGSTGGGGGFSFGTPGGGGGAGGGGAGGGGGGGGGASGGGGSSGGGSFGAVSFG